MTRERYPSFQFAPSAPLIPSALAGIGAWCANHFVFVSIVVLSTAFVAGMLTGATL